MGVYKIWQVLYPIGMYYVASSIAFFVLELLIGTGQDTYMLRQTVCAAVTVPFILPFYREDGRIETVVYGQKQQKDLLWWGICSAFSAAALGIAVNNLIAMTPLMQASAGFSEANEAFFGGKFVYELLGSCLMIPIAEELLYRGVVYRRLRMLFGTQSALVLSAVVFGLVHFNLVQFLYAGILGLLLAFLMEKTGKLWAPVLGHMAANTVAVVRQETGWLAFSYEPTAAGIGFSALLLAAAGGIVWQMGKKE